MVRGAWGTSSRNKRSRQQQPTAHELPIPPSRPPPVRSSHNPLAPPAPVRPSPPHPCRILPPFTPLPYSSLTPSRSPPPLPLFLTQAVQQVSRQYVQEEFSLHRHGQALPQTFRSVSSRKPAPRPPTSLAPFTPASLSQAVSLNPVPPPLTPFPPPVSYGVPVQREVLLKVLPRHLLYRLSQAVALHLSSTCNSIPSQACSSIGVKCRHAHCRGASRKLSPCVGRR